MYQTSEKYRPLFEHLLYNGKEQVTMSLSAIERVLGKKLPASARSRSAWWSNNPTGHSQASSGWLRAGYRTSGVDLTRQRVTFTLEAWPERYSRLSEPGAATANPGLGEPQQADYRATTAAADQRKITEEPATPGEKPFPAWGVWVGKVTLLPDYDYTQPADPDWGKVYDS